MYDNFSTYHTKTKKVTKEDVNVKSGFDKVNISKTLYRDIMMTSACAPFLMLKNDIKSVSKGTINRLRVTESNKILFNQTNYSYLQIEQYITKGMDATEMLETINHIYFIDTSEMDISPFIFITKYTKTQNIKVLAYGFKENHLIANFKYEGHIAIEDLLFRIFKIAEGKNLTDIARYIDLMIMSKVGENIKL